MLGEVNQSQNFFVVEFGACQSQACLEVKLLGVELFGEIPRTCFLKSLVQVKWLFWWPGHLRAGTFFVPGNDLIKDLSQLSQRSRGRDLLKRQ